ncbi:hypothetical protein NE237_026380 [Protea cynaroides]|uniref:RING-type domain-containing protein n=1 Tax=Protea cynaroides TaxID=273540 RepID=A0A9Q0K0F2_9MAGN|nr:hypothetical protein NE237_026380 [Protea cynaroides]
MNAKEEENFLECPICWESLNLVENEPHILWCGHSLCKTCILSLQSVEIKFPFLSMQLPILISCPWCQFLCFKLVWKGNLKFPRKNYFLLWLVESATGNRTSCPPTTDSVSQGSFPSSSVENLHESPPGFFDARQTVINLHRSLPSLVQLIVKFLVVFIITLMLSYVIMGSIVILVVYFFITFLFAVPSFWILCFFHPILERLVREVTA